MTEPPEPPPLSFRDRLLGALEQRLDLSELFSFISHFGLVMVPLDTRRPLRELLRDLDAIPVPEYVRGRQSLGVLVAVLFAIEALTGMLLAFHYLPTPDAAHSSTLTIVRDVPFGGVIHQVHVWGALALILVVVLRLLRLFWDGLWKAPREVLWCSAVALVWLSLQFDFTGRLLTWDAHGHWSTVRGIEVVYALPAVGPALAFLLGGRVPQGRTAHAGVAAALAPVPEGSARLARARVADVRSPIPQALSPHAHHGDHELPGARAHRHDTQVLVHAVGVLAVAAVRRVQGGGRDPQDRRAGHVLVLRDPPR